MPCCGASVAAGGSLPGGLAGPSHSFDPAAPASVHTMAALQRLRQLRGLQGWQLRGLAAAAQPAPADDLIEVFVDGNSVKIPKGANVLSACTAAGVDVPR